MGHEHFCKLLYCTSIVMCCFTFQNAGKSITYNIYNSQGLTFLYPMQFTINYFISPLALLFVDAIIQRLNFGVVLYLGSFNAFAFLLGAFVVSSCEEAALFYCNVPTLTSVIAVETLFGGVASCLFFVGYPIYINSISNPQNKTLYFGIGYSIYSISGFLGNTIGFFTSTKLSPFHYYSILITGLAITQLLLLLVKDLRDKKKIEKQPINLIYHQQLNQLKTAFKNKDYRVFVPFLILSSMLQGCYFTFIPSLLKYTQGGVTNNQHTFLLYLIGGIGMVFGGLVAGKLSQKVNLFIVGWIQIVFAITFASLSIFSYCQKLTITTYVAGFFCGVVFTGSESLMAMITGVLVSDKNYYFVANDIVTCLGIAMTSCISLILNKIDFVYMTYTVGVLAILNALSLVYAKRQYKSEIKLLD